MISMGSTHVLIICLTASLITSQSHGRSFCVHNSTKALAQFSTTDCTNVICTNMVLTNTTKLRMEDQKKPLYRRTYIQLLNITGNFTIDTLKHLPFVKSMLIYRSEVEIFDTHPRNFIHLHIVESKFPNITNDLFKEYDSISSLGFHSNPGLHFEDKPFRELRFLWNLIIYNQSLPKITEKFLETQISIQFLLLNKNGLTDIDENAFKYSPELREINLDDNPLQVFTADIRYLHKLERLSLLHTNVKVFHVTEFFPLREMHTLSVPYPAAIDIGVQGLAIAFPNLRCFFVDSQSITGDPQVSSLEKFRLAGLRIDNVKSSLNTSIYFGARLYTYSPEPIRGDSVAVTCTR